MAAIMAENERHMEICYKCAHFSDSYSGNLSCDSAYAGFEDDVCAGFDPKDDNSDNGYDPDGAEKMSVFDEESNRYNGYSSYEEYENEWN